MKEKTKNIFLSAAVFLSAFLIFSCGKNDGPVPPPAAPEKYAINLIVGDGGESVSATVNDSTVVPDFVNVSFLTSSTCHPKIIRE